MNIALAAVFKRNPGLQESLQDEIDNKPGWYQKFKRDLSAETEELSKNRLSEKYNRAREIVQGLFAENATQERKSLSTLPNSTSDYSQPVKREIQERERLESEKRGLHLKQLELELKLLKLKSENDFERKMNDLELLKHN